MPPRGLCGLNPIAIQLPGPFSAIQVAFNAASVAGFHVVEKIENGLWIEKSNCHDFRGLRGSGFEFYGVGLGVRVARSFWMGAEIG